MTRETAKSRELKLEINIIRVADRIPKAFAGEICR
jgi:hypothetical protein